MAAPAETSFNALLSADSAVSLPDTDKDVAAMLTDYGATFVKRKAAAADRLDVEGSARDLHAVRGRGPRLGPLRCWPAWSHTPSNQGDGAETSSSAPALPSGRLQGPLGSSGASIAPRRGQGPCLRLAARTPPPRAPGLCARAGLFEPPT